MVALTIVSIVGIAALSALSAQLGVATQSRENIEAAALAQDRVARTRLLTGEELSALPDSMERGVFDPPFAAYRWETQIDANVEEPGLFDVNVRITWDRGSYEVTTRIYRSLMADSPGLGAP